MNNKFEENDWLLKGGEYNLMIETRLHKKEWEFAYQQKFFDYDFLKIRECIRVVNDFLPSKIHLVDALYITESQLNDITSIAQHMARNNPEPLNFYLAIELNKWIQKNL